MSNGLSLLAPYCAAVMSGILHTQWLYQVPNGPMVCPISTFRLHMSVICT